MKQEKKNYKPIACALYDELTLFVMHKQKVKLIYTDKESPERTLEKETMIKDVYTKEGEEFILLENKEIIRLDRLLKVDEKEFLGRC